MTTKTMSVRLDEDTWHRLEVLGTQMVPIKISCRYASAIWFGL